MTAKKNKKAPGPVTGDTWNHHEPHAPGKHATTGWNWLQGELANSHIYLGPLMEEHEEELYSVASDPLLWAQHPNPERHTREGFTLFFEGAIQSGATLLIRDLITGQVIGTSRFYDVHEETGSIAIGYTFLSRTYWGGTYNQALKTLMLDQAFSRYRQVQFHIGIRNVRSQKAIEKIGATRIGEMEMKQPGQTPIKNLVYQINRTSWLTRIRSDIAPGEYYIRKAYNTDSHAAKEVVREVLAEYRLVFDENGVDHCLSNLELHYHHGGGCFAVLTHYDGQIMGTIGVMNKGNGTFELKKMFIRREVRGRGYGKMMMRFVFCFLCDKACTSLHLETKSELVEAIGLYKRFGFVEVPSEIQNDRVDRAFVLKWN